MVARELRSVERFPLKLPVRLVWEASGRRRRQTEGITRDISSRGMYVQARSLPPPGARLQFEISMIPDEYSEPVRIEGKGRVVRVEDRPGRPAEKGFAVVNLWFQVVEAQRG